MKTAALPLTLLLAGCFSPHFLEGAFACGPGGLCPDEQSCSPLDNHCYARPPIAVFPDAGVPEASSDAGDESPPDKRELWQVCDVTHRNSPNRTDNCIQGAVCIEGDKDARCLPKCSMTGPDTCYKVFGPCELRKLGTTDTTGPVAVCGPPVSPCDPTAKVSGCAANLTCFVRGSDTYCDLVSGDGGNTSSCPNGNGQCLSGFSCGTEMRCHRTCAAGSMCPGTGDACVLASPAALFGICP